MKPNEEVKEISETTILLLNFCSDELLLLQDRRLILLQAFLNSESVFIDLFSHYDKKQSRLERRRSNHDEFFFSLEKS